MQGRLFALLVLAGFLLFSCSRGDRLVSVDEQGRTVVERFGQLRVEGTKLLAADGKPVQLRG